MPLPSLTVAMPAYNAAGFIREALDSVLSQRGVDLEVIVVDDASTDDTADLVQRIGDERCRLLWNSRRRGIGHSHNRVLQESRAPVIAHVDADDKLRKGALAQMVAALESDERVGLAHCYFYDVDSTGRTTRAEFCERSKVFRRERPVDLDYREALRNSPAKANALRTYRRSVLIELGGFNEDIPFGVDYEMTLRILERHEILLVPKFFYARRLHATNTTESLVFKRARLWLRKYLIRRSVLRKGQVTYWRDANFDPLYFLNGERMRLSGRIRAAFRGRGTAS